MAGITKRKYMSENIRIYKQMTNQLNSIKKILPEIYDGNILFDLYSEYFSTTKLNIYFHMGKDCSINNNTVKNLKLTL